VSPSSHSATITWAIKTSTRQSSYITEITVHLNGKEYKIIDRGTEVTINQLKLNTPYTVGIQSQDGSSQKSEMIYKTFKTIETGNYRTGFVKYALLKILFETIFLFRSIFSI
jgi:hypothetical protein